MYRPAVAYSCDDISPKTKAAKLRQLLEITDRFDGKVTFFVIPKSRDLWNSSNSLVRLLKDAEKCGHEIGLHGLNHYPFETGYPLSVLNSDNVSIKSKVTIGLKILNEVLETNPRGFRAPYHLYNRELLKVLDDMNFLYDSSKIALTGYLLSYTPPLRAIWLLRKKGPPASRIFHPLNLKIWEIPVTQEYTWHNLHFEASYFRAFLKNYVPKIKSGCLVINSHIGTLSTESLRILKQLFQYIKETGLRSLTLEEIAEKHTPLETVKAYYA